MTDPVTNNIALAIPTRGSNVGVWDVPVNSDFNSIDGFFGGVQTISATSTNIVLTSPAGSITPSGGPTQAENAVLRFIGSLSAPVQVTLPLPGFYIVENLTTGNFVLSFRAVSSGAVIAIDQGEILHIENDGTNVKFVNLGRIGHTEIWAGLTAMPAWVTACTNPPYLLCDGTIYNFSSFPYLGARLLAAFGGNGITTFGVPDLQGRVQLPYDGTGTRITTAGSGLNGQTIGAALDQQTQTLQLTQLPTGITSSGSLSVSGPGGDTPLVQKSGSTISNFNLGGTGTLITAGLGINSIGDENLVTSGTLTSNNTNGNPHPNVQPSQVTGIAVIRAA